MGDEFVDIDRKEVEQAVSDFRQSGRDFRTMAAALQAVLTAVIASIYGNFAAGVQAALTAAIERAMSSADFSDKYAGALEQALTRTHNDDGQSQVAVEATIQGA